ncbi:hypothetical protein [Streptomyces deccanensis]|uniref:hypothetical protein n=1 Tax=Streptomyces deccanensis TaxID=424188 RepID=UPI0030B82692
MTGLVPGRGSAAAVGTGLVGVRERAAAHGGTVEVRAGPGGRGVEVRVRIPVAAGVPDAAVTVTAGGRWGYSSGSWPVLRSSGWG